MIIRLCENDAVDIYLIILRDSRELIPKRENERRSFVSHFYLLAPSHFEEAIQARVSRRRYYRQRARTRRFPRCGGGEEGAQHSHCRGAVQRERGRLALRVKTRSLPPVIPFLTARKQPWLLSARLQFLPLAFRKVFTISREADCHNRIVRCANNGARLFTRLTIKESIKQNDVSLSLRCLDLVYHLH